MTGREFVRRLRRLGRKHGVAVTLVASRGKGGHQTVYYGERFTIVQTGEIPAGTLHRMCRQLAIDPKDL